jgi:hypothetical protein
MAINPSTPICGPPAFRRCAMLAAVGAVLVLLVPAVVAQESWVQFSEETSSRLSVAAGMGATDPDEKDYAWGDLDKDGDIDLVVVRKQPVTTTGKRVNVLLMNENGVLVDRTAQFATDTDVPGDQGFLTPTNDRDVAMVDVDNDGWLDVITVTAISSGDPKHIGHPRIYHNKGCSGGCAGSSDWLGLRFENSRIPALLADNGQAGFNPCFCSVSAGDVNKDGYADLWFQDYDTACGDADFNDKLLLNVGESNPGFFVDVTETSFANANFPVSGFGASGDVRDMNGDGELDLMKQFAGFVGIATNDSTGFFDKDTSPYGGSAYFASVGELNNDDRLDLIVSDDGQDRYFLNQGNGPDGLPDFLSFTFSYLHLPGGGNASDDGFGGNNMSADLDKDGFEDVIVTDVDVDVFGCGRRAHIYRNLGGPPGGDVVLQEQTTGSGCQNFMSNPATCIVASIPANKLEGTFDVATFDINGDTFLDLVIGRCSGTEVYVNLPPGPPSGSIPDGDEVPGSQLLVSRGLGNQIILSWDDSCTLDDTDYEIYEGRLDIGDFDVHAKKVCSTGGVKSLAVSTESDVSSYYLVVPTNGIFEGSYGTKSNGSQRPQGVPACRAQALGECQE